jgi:predicted RNA-binding Zn-ribbon protein involved in translation (DUF1610 family)
MNIRHLMLLVLYSAVALGVFLSALKLPVRDRTRLVGLALCAASTALAGLPWFIHRPGPWRDWLVRLFTCSALVWVLFSLSVDISRGGLDALFSAFFCLQLGFASIWLAKQGLIPGDCPHCGRKALVKATPDTRSRKTALRAVAYVCESCGVVTFPRRGEVARGCSRCGRTLSPGNSDLSPHYVCESCGVVTYAPRGRIAQGCSRCGRSRWVDSPVPDRWEYYWCLACERRSKERVDGTWEAADGPEDEGPYSRWDFLGWVEALLARWSSSVGIGSRSGDPRPPEALGRPNPSEGGTPTREVGSQS